MKGLAINSKVIAGVLEDGWNLMQLALNVNRGGKWTTQGLGFSGAIYAGETKKIIE